MIRFRRLVASLRVMPVKLLLGAVTAPLLFGLVFVALQPRPQIEEEHFTTITGHRIVWSDLRGKPALVTFWATDCPACAAEIPQLLDIYRRYHRQGLEMIAIAMYYDPPSHVVAMTQAKQLPYPVVLDLTGEYAKAFGEVRLIPTTFLINRAGKVVLRTTGLVDTGDMAARIEQLLKEG